MTPMRLLRVLVLVALLGSVIASLLVAMLQGPSEIVPALRSFANGVAGNETAVGATGKAVCPILLIGVAACLAFRAGLFDVGQIGQFVIGGCAAGAVAAHVPGPGLVVIIVTIMTAAAAGATWSLIVSAFARWTGLELVVLSLVANYLADAFARLATRTMFQDKHSYGVIATDAVPRRAWLPLLLTNTSLHVGIVVALATLVAAWFLLRRTVFGHRLMMFGRNPLAAQFAGVNASRLQNQVLLTTGAVCGSAGALEVLGVFHRYQDGSLGGSNSVAWTGLTAAILVPVGMLALLPVATLLAALSTGFNGVQIELGISTGLSALLEGVVVITAAFAIRAPRDTSRAARRRPRSSTRNTPLVDGSQS